MGRWFTPVLIAAVAFGGYVFFLEKVEAPATTPSDNRVMDINSYVRQNINTLSPEPPVLGGSHHVTNIETSGGHGTVWYEDGHNAFTGDFEYVIDKYGISVSMFEVRKGE